MKLLFCIILILLAAIKKGKWNSDFTHYLLQDDTNATTIRLSNFRPIVIKGGNFLSTALRGGSKVNRFHRALTPFPVNVSKSVSDIWIQQGIVIQKIFGLWDFGHPVFGRFVLKLSCWNGQTVTTVRIFQMEPTLNWRRQCLNFVVILPLIVFCSTVDFHYSNRSSLKTSIWYSLSSASGRFMRIWRGSCSFKSSRCSLFRRE